jgi:hypothetical protein
MRQTILSFGFGIAVALSACASVTEETRDGESVGVASAAIINGQIDTTHSSVVLVHSQSGQSVGHCTGTIIKVDVQRKIGWVLTAAHCVEIPPVTIVLGDDFASSTALGYAVVDWTKDTRYEKPGDPYDFAVVRIAGVDATTPVTPVATSFDGIAVGSPVVAVGYGRTNLIASGPPDNNTKRRKANLLAMDVSSTMISYDTTIRGTCQGDSGGPDIAIVGGKEVVVGVHSIFQGSDCNSVGSSARTVSGAGFINGELGKALPPDDCALCGKVAVSGKETCAELNRACFADASCKSLYDCVVACPKGSASCAAACEKKNPKGVGPLIAAASCTCTRSCTKQCGSTSECAVWPKCGLSTNAKSCTACIESACCEAALDCTADGTCFACMSSGGNCAGNARHDKLATCIQSKCAAPCSGSGAPGSTPGDAPPPPTPEEEGTTPANTPPAASDEQPTSAGCAVASPAKKDGRLAIVLGSLVLLVLRRASRKKCSKAQMLKGSNARSSGHAHYATRITQRERASEASSIRAFEHSSF